MLIETGKIPTRLDKNLARKKKSELLLLREHLKLSTPLYQKAVTKKKNELPLLSIMLPSAMSLSFHRMKIKRKNIFMMI